MSRLGVQPGGGGSGGSGVNPIVSHGTDATVTRPAVTSGPVYWVGTVQPNNALDGDVWLDTDDTASGGTGAVKYRSAGSFALVDDAVDKTIYDANTILVANTDNTPVALTVAASRIVGRASTGNIDDLTPAQVVDIIRTSFPVEREYAVGDEASTITTGTAKLTFRMPHGMTLTAVRASVNTASTSGVVTVDINEGGVSVLSTKLTIDANEKTSQTAAIAPVISDAALADDAEITVDVDTAGTGAKGLKIVLIGTRT